MATVAPQVIPTPGPNLTTGAISVPVVALGQDINGGWITNPSTATEPLYVDPTGAAPQLAEGGTTFAIWPGGTYVAIPGQGTVTQVVAPDLNHPFTAVQW